MTVDSLIRTRVMTTGALFLMWLLFFGSMVTLASPPVLEWPVAETPWKLMAPAPDGPLPCAPAQILTRIPDRPCADVQPACVWCSENGDIGYAPASKPVHSR